MFESLESRRLASVTAFSFERTVYVFGTAGDDDIVIRGGAHTSIWADGKEVLDVPAYDGFRVVVFGNEGHDRIDASAYDPAGGPLWRVGMARFVAARGVRSEADALPVPAGPTAFALCWLMQLAAVAWFAYAERSGLRMSGYDAPT